MSKHLDSHRPRANPLKAHGLSLFLPLGHDGKGGTSPGKNGSVIRICYRPIQEGDTPAWLNHPCRGRDSALPDALQETGALGDGGNALAFIQHAEKGQGHGFIAQCREKASLQPSRPVKHIGSNHHGERGLSSIKQAQLDPEKTIMGPGWSMGLMTVLVGCSGWSYDDWVGRFYPIELARKKGEWLAYYGRYFQTVEINSTFYRPPGELQVASWIKKGIELKDFEYSLKMPQLVTHKSMVQGDSDRAFHWAKSFEKTCIMPLDEAGLLGCVLLQLSPRFQNMAGALATLETVLEALSFRDYNYAVEFRHRSWLDEGGKQIDPNVM